MSAKKFTPAQIATFDVFAEAVKTYLDAHSEGKRNAKLMERKAFGAIFETASRPSMLLPVMNNVTHFTEHGRTKESFQLRYGAGHPQEGQLQYRPNGTAVMSNRHCVMYTTDAYREMRAKITGLKSPEPVYFVRWSDVPENIQNRLSKKFPRKGENYPEFTPLQLGITLRSGRQPEKGEKRHKWAGFDFIVVGTYGETNVVITQAAVGKKPCVAALAEIVGCACPDWGQNEAQEKEEATVIALAAASRVADDDSAFIEF